MVGTPPPKKRAGQPEGMQVRDHADEKTPRERKLGKLRGDAVRTPDRSREGLGLLARMIARAYLRDRNPGGSSADVEGTSIRRHGEKVTPDCKEVQDETRYNQETQ